MKKLNLTIISGSHRKTSESGKVATYIEKTIQSQEDLNSRFKPSILNLADEKLPFFDDSPSDKEEKIFKEQWEPISEKLNSSDAFIIISPEWNGMVPAQLKNLFLLVNREFFHKPALLVTTSAGLNGSYPIVELRMSSYKNSRILYLPEHLIIKNVGEFNKNHDHQNFTEVRERLINNLHILLMYADRLKGIDRDIKKLLYTEKYPHGM